MIPAWLTVSLARYAAVAALSALAAWWLTHTLADARESRLIAAHAQDKEAWATAANDAIDAEIKRSKTRAAELEKAREQATKLASSARADANRAAGTVARLQSDLDQIRRHAQIRDPSLAIGSPAGTDATGMLAYMLGKSIDRNRVLAGVADRAFIAGLTCEQAYEAVRK